MTTELTVEAILEAFPNKIQPIIGRPASQTLTELKQLLYENAATIPSNIGGGNHGHLGIIMPPAIFFIMAGGAAWIAPNNPGVAPAIPAGATGPQMQRIITQFKNDQAVFRTYHNVDKALKQQIINAVPNMYIKALSNRILSLIHI